MEIGNRVKSKGTLILGTITQTNTERVGGLPEQVHSVLLDDGRTIRRNESDLEVVPFVPFKVLDMVEVIEASNPIWMGRQGVIKSIVNGGHAIIDFDGQEGGFAVSQLRLVGICPRKFYEKLNTLKTAEREQFLKSTVLDSLFKHNDIIAIHALMNLVGLKNGG